MYNGPKVKTKVPKVKTTVKAKKKSGEPKGKSVGSVTLYANGADYYGHPLEVGDLEDALVNYFENDYTLKDTFTEAKKAAEEEARGLEPDLVIYKITLTATRLGKVELVYTPTVKFTAA